VAKVVTFLGTRSEIIKLSPLIPALSQHFEHALVHSGQHTAPEMDSLFFEELGLPPADHSLQVGFAPHAQQIARMMIGFEAILLERRPAALILLGGTNTALAGALTGIKLEVRVAHLEAGVRTLNPRMPEEINRALIDRMSNWLFAPDERARRQLLAEGLDSRHIDIVGSTTIDACRRNLHLAEARPTLERMKLTTREYIVLTVHRAENTEPDTLGEIVAAVNALSRIWPIVFPIHPRTRQALGDTNPFGENVKVISPLGYLDMLNLAQRARVLLTDSSGLQEEAAALGTPALIIRNETEWPHLIELGSSALVGNTYHSLMDRAWPLIASDAALDAMRRRADAASGGAVARILSRLASDLGVSLQSEITSPPEATASSPAILESPAS